jgi:hypothetical protein
VAPGLTVTSGPDDDFYSVRVEGDVAGDGCDSVVRRRVEPHRINQPAVSEGDAVVGGVALVRTVRLGGAGREQRLVDIAERDVVD